MDVTIRPATADDHGAIVALDFRNFGIMEKSPEDELPEGLLDLDRFLVAEDGGDLVGAAGSYAMELTLHGGGTIPMAGVTWVSVAASHRRRGLLRRLMAGLDDLAVAADEPALGLTASEGPIYERFGYGITSHRRVIELDRRRATIDPSLEPEPVRLIDAADHVDELQAIYDRYRLTQPGEVSRSEPLFRENAISTKKANPAAIHADGYAVWSVEPAWQNGHPAHTLHLSDLIAVTPQAHLALWNLVLSIDLVGPISSFGAVAPDDRLPFLLSDQRALRTVELNDGLWLKVADIARCFEARRYRADGRVVIGVTEEVRVGPSTAPAETVAITVDGGAATVTPSDDPPDLVVGRAALGPLLLGVPAARLATGSRLAGSEAALVTADVVFGSGVGAHSRTGF
ncbi:MAG: GNAT family N-acetyltransferase [Actinomycetota bacterium]